MAAVVGNGARLVLASAAGATLATNGGADSFLAALNSIFGTGPGGELSKEALLQQMQLLTEVMRTQNKGVTVVTNGGNVGARGLGCVLLLVGAGTAVAYYKGYRLDDVAWVSKAAFKVAQRNIALGMDNLKDAVVTLRSELLGKVAEVHAKVDGLTEGQGEINDRVRGMGEQMDAVAMDVTKIDEMLERMTSQMEGVMNNQDYTNQGIYILCALTSQMFVVGQAGNQSPAVTQQRMRLLEKLNGFISNFNGAADDVNHQLLQEAKTTLELGTAPAMTDAAPEVSVVGIAPPPGPPAPSASLPVSRRLVKESPRAARVVKPAPKAASAEPVSVSQSTKFVAGLLSNPHVAGTLRRMSASAGAKADGDKGISAVPSTEEDFARFMEVVTRQTSDLQSV